MSTYFEASRSIHESGEVDNASLHFQVSNKLVSMISNFFYSKQPEIRLSALSSDYGAKFLHLMYKCISTCVLGLIDKFEGEPWKHPYGVIKGHP